jgi:hypothetical protein
MIEAVNAMRLNMISSCIMNDSDCSIGLSPKLTLISRVLGACEAAEVV